MKNGLEILVDIKDHLKRGVAMSDSMKKELIDLLYEEPDLLIIPE